MNKTNLRNSMTWTGGYYFWLLPDCDTDVWVRIPC